ncbi:MAG: TrkA family potassium uptake protein [Erysipelotrichaceae bacterium]|nr:TrkA family potassium uptake protein [Erysipelotrichaceae bacterium]
MVQENWKKDSYVCIIGCGRLGANLGNMLSVQGKDVLIMDKDKNSFRRLSSHFGGLVIEGDGTDLDKLKEVKIQNASSVIIVTNDDNINIMIAQIARDLFGVKQVIARLYDPEREQVYHQLGINTICPVILSVKEIVGLLE